MRHTLVKLAAATALVATAQFSHAQPGTDLESIHESGRHMAHISEQLGLTEEQRSEIEAIFTASHEMYEDEREQLESLRDELQVLVEEGFDEGAAQSIADDIGRLTSTLAFGRALTKSQVRSVLTDEQLQTLSDLHEMRNDRRAMMRDFHRGSFRGASATEQRRVF